MDAIDVVQRVRLDVDGEQKIAGSGTVLPLATLRPKPYGLSWLHTGRNTDLEPLLTHGTSSSFAGSTLHLEAVACAGARDTREVHVAHLRSTGARAGWTCVLSCAAATTAITARGGAADNHHLLVAGEQFLDGAAEGLLDIWTLLLTRWGLPLRTASESPSKRIEEVVDVDTATEATATEVVARLRRWRVIG